MTRRDPNNLDLKPAMRIEAVETYMDRKAFQVGVKGEGDSKQILYIRPIDGDGAPYQILIHGPGPSHARFIVDKLGDVHDFVVSRHANTTPNSILVNLSTFKRVPKDEAASLIAAADDDAFRETFARDRLSDGVAFEFVRGILASQEVHDVTSSDRADICMLLNKTEITVQFNDFVSLEAGCVKMNLCVGNSGDGTAHLSIQILRSDHLEDVDDEFSDPPLLSLDLPEIIVRMTNISDSRVHAGRFSGPDLFKIGDLTPGATYKLQAEFV